MKEPLPGWKTWIGLFLTAILLFASKMGYIPETVYNNLIEWVALATGCSVVKKLSRIEKTVKTVKNGN